MTDEKCDVPFSVAFTHRMRFTMDAFDVANDCLCSVLPTSDAPARILPFIDSGVAESHPDLVDRVRRYFIAHGDAMALAGAPVITPGGEHAKNDPDVWNDALRAIHDAHLCRQSYVLIIGGGSVLDAVGYAAAIAHRGVRVIRMPTTTLAQDDSGVGVKNGVNAFGKKNYLGVFAAPWAVINDESFLDTLSERDWRCGLSEAIKVALVKDAMLFDLIESEAPALATRDLNAARPILRRSALLHLRHITDGGDPFEMTEARPLDFGHWSAHRIEQATDFEVRHGEAVAMGVALDVEYARRIGLLDDASCDRVLDTLEAIGFDLWVPSMSERSTLLAGIEEFREHLGGRLTIAMIEAIGVARDVHTIDHDVMMQAVDALKQRHDARVATGDPAS